LLGVGNLDIVGDHGQVTSLHHDCSFTDAVAVDLGDGDLGEQEQLHVMLHPASVHFEADPLAGPPLPRLPGTHAIDVSDAVQIVAGAE
jgi:hypothetical protein